MSKKIKGSYLLNAVGVALVFALLTGLFAANAFGTSTTYIQGICTTACYTIIMVTSLNLVVGFFIVSPSFFNVRSAFFSRISPDQTKSAQPRRQAGAARLCAKAKSLLGNTA